MVCRDTGADRPHLRFLISLEECIDATLKAIPEYREWLFRVALTKWKIEGDSNPLISYRQTERGLSSNLSAMYDSYVQILAKARRLSPAIVDQHSKIASARMLRYLARRALRVDRSRARAQHYVMRALKEGPGIFFHEPKQTLATLVAAFVPGCELLFNALRNTNPR